MTAFKCEDCDKIRADIKDAVAELKSEDTNKVLEGIKAEIDQKQYDFMADKDYDDGIRFGLMLAYQIVHKHISGKEQE